MLDPKDIERYRRMTVGERLDELMLLMQMDEAEIAFLPATEREKRLQLIEAEHRASNDALLSALSRH